MMKRLTVLIALTGCPSTGHMGETGGDAAVASDVRDIDAPPDAPPTLGPLRVGTFNLHCLFDNPDLRMTGVAAEVKARKLDAIGLEEACESLSSGGTDNSAKLLASKLTAATGQPWQFFFVPTHPAWNMYQEGVAIVAPAGALSLQGSRELPYRDGLRRKLGFARVTTDHGSFVLHVTHNSISSDEQDRIDEVNNILDQTKNSIAPGIPQIVVGDFNATPNAGSIQKMLAGPPAFVDTFAAANPGQPGYTIDATNPHARIDYIFVNAASLDTIESSQVAFNGPYMGTYLSDHIGVVTQFMPRP